MSDSRLDPTIPGSPANIMLRLHQLREDVQQQVWDMESVNDNNPHFADCPMDAGAERMALQKIDKAIETLERTGDTRGILDEIIEQLEARLADDD